MATSFETVSPDTPSSAYATSLSPSLALTFYDSETIDTLVWENFSEGKKAKAILLPLVKQGSELFIANVKTKVFVITCGQHLFPLTVNEEEYENSYIASNYYIVALLEEWTSRFHPAFRPIQKPLTAVLGKMLKGIKANKIVLLNNWLFTSNILPEMNAAELEALHALVRVKFPDHLIMWRNLETFHGEKLHGWLKKLGFRLMRTRTLYFYDPSWKDSHSSKVHYHHRRDLRLIEKQKYEVIRNSDLKESDYPRILELYRKVYMEKHTSYSPDFTVEFLKNAISHNSLSFIGLRKNGQIDGIMGIFSFGKTMICSIFGFDTSQPTTLGLYRMLTMLLIHESQERHLILNDGSGGVSTKKYRGLKPFQEYVALDAEHLPWGRRVFWQAMEKIVNYLVYPFLKKTDVKD